MVVNEQHFDVCIIGAGIIGSTLSYLLSKEHENASICLLDKSLSGMGATMFSAGLDLPFSINEVHREMALYGRKYYAALAQNNSYRKNINVTIMSKKSFPEIKSKIFDPQVIQSDYSGTDDSLICEYASYNSILKLESFIYNPLALIDFYQRAFLKSNNNKLIQGALIEGIDPLEHSKFKINLSNGLVFTSDKIVFCTGPWINTDLSILKDFYCFHDLKVKKIVSYLFSSSKDLSIKDAYCFEDIDAFVLPLDDSKVLLSIRSEDWNCHPNSSTMYLSRLDEKILDTVLKRIKFEQYLTRIGARVFCDLYSPDRVPIVAYVNTNENIVFAGACSGSGVRLAPGISSTALKLLNL